jgi:hypothetical protein
MKKKSNDGRSRRKFLSLSLLGGAGLLSQKATAMLPVQPEEETVPMLTPDGKLVQVNKHILDQMQERQKAANKDILDWTTTQTKNNP